MILGQEQHIGTRAPPRELILENTVMPPDPGIVRVQVSLHLLYIFTVISTISELKWINYNVVRASTVRKTRLY